MIVITLLRMATINQLSNCILITVVDLCACADLLDWVWGIYRRCFATNNERGLSWQESKFRRSIIVWHALLQANVSHGLRLSSSFKNGLLPWSFTMAITHSSLFLNADVHRRYLTNSVQTQPVTHHLLECVILLPAISCKAVTKNWKTSVPLTLTIKLELSKQFSCMSAERCSHLQSSLSCCLCFHPRTCRWNRHISHYVSYVSVRVPTSSNTRDTISHNLPHLFDGPHNVYSNK